MPYLGNTPASNFASVTKDSFSGDGSTTAFTLSKTATTNGVAVFVENVRQEPTTAYAVSGTTLTFTAAPVSASGNNIYVLHHNTPASTATHPAAQDLTAANSTFTGTLGVTGESTLTGDATLSRSNQNGTVRLNLENTGAGGSTDYSEIKFNSTAGSTVTSIVQHRNNSGMNIGTSTAHPLTLITSGNTAMSVDANGHVTKPLQPCFLVRNSSNQSNISLATLVTVVFDTEVFDQNADFASNTFTAPVTGRYLFTYNVNFSQADADHTVLQLTLSTSNNAFTNNPSTDLSAAYSSDPSTFALNGAVICDMDANDTALVKLSCEGGAAQTDIVSNGVRTNFGGVLLA